MHKHSESNEWPVVEALSLKEKLDRVQRLPAPVPGVVVNVPLALLPLYMQLHEIEPKSYRVETRCLIVKKQGNGARYTEERK